MPIRPPSHLPDAPLAEALDAVVASDRTSDAVVLAHVAEFDARKLYLPAGHASMFRYCIDHLRMSEDVAYKRVRVARVARRWPGVFDAIESGQLNLSAVALLAKHLTRANAAELLRSAAGQTREQIQLLLAQRGLLEPGACPLAVAPGSAPIAVTPAVAGLAGAESISLANVTTTSSEQAPGPVECISTNEIAVIPAPTTRRARVTPVGPNRFELVAILGQEAYDQLVASRELLGHAVPSGDLAEVLERAIALQFAQLRKRRCAAAARPRKHPVERPAHPRHIPAAVRREVWERDGGRCTFSSPDGHVCGSRDRLEIDHVVPVAQGGQATVANLRPLCRAHNQHVAERALGERTMRDRREVAQRRRAADRAHRQAAREREAVRKAALRRQHEELGGALRSLGYRGEDLRRALAHCVDRADGPLEDRLKYALGRMAPNVRRERPAESGPAPPR